MDKEKILEDFFLALRIALTNASSYSKDHPYFIKSIKNFKVRVEDTLVVLNPFFIGVTSLGIVVDGKNLTKSGFYDEIACLLHQRKIKSIEIRSGVNLEELIRFLSVISLPQKDILKGGGINAILEDKPLAHFRIEELDYSEFLRGQAHECSDLWGYMLKDAAHSKDAQKLEILADDFGSLIKRSSQKDILEAEDLPLSIADFLISLKGKNKEKFDKCSRDVFLWLLHNKKSLKEDELEKLKPVFKSLDQDDFSNLLWEGISSEDSFDNLSLQFFSKISEQKNLPEAAENFLDKTGGPQRLKDNPKAVKKIQDLLTGSQGQAISPVYRKILESLIRGASASGVKSFDQKMLRQNYRYIVLNLLSIAQDPDNLELTAGILGRELAGIFEDNDLGLLKDLYSLLAKKKKEGIGACIELEKELSLFIENTALDQGLTVEQEFLLDMVSSPARKANDYLDKIFTSDNAGKQALTLFFRLFPDQLDVFYRRLKQKLHDTDFVAGLIDSLSKVEAPIVLPIFEHIYSSANELIKCETLKAMRKLKKVDVGFIIRQLGTGSFTLRKNLLAVLILDAQGREAALDSLFKVPGLWGSKNKFLIENIQIVFDLQIISAAGRIRDLAKKRFFWNRGLRHQAKQVLGEWNAL